MATNARKTPIEYDLDKEKNTKFSKRTPLIKSEVEYSQNVQTTRDVGTELEIETDEVNITTEIYSLTDLPACLQPDEQIKPKPGIIVPEYKDGNCMILKAYRCKCVNTIESYDPVCPIKCIFPSIKIQQEFVHVTHSFKTDNTHNSCLNAGYPCVTEENGEIYRSDSLCRTSCPNLIINESSQTDETFTVCKKPEDQGDSAEFSVSIDGSVKEHTVDDSKFSDVDSLTTIQELSEGTEDFDTVEKQSEMESERTEESKEESLDQSEETIVKTYDTPKDSKQKVRKSSTSIFEMGTILMTNSSTWLDRPRRQGSCKLFSTQASKTCYCGQRKISSKEFCMRLSQPLMIHCMVQCEIIRDNERSCYFVDRQRTPSTSSEYCSSRCPDHESYCNSTTSESKNFWSSEDYRTRSRRDFGSYREPFTRHQLCRINNSQGCSIPERALENCAQNSSNRNNACNQYYLNLNKAYNTIGRYCSCNNRYNNRDANAHCYSAGSRAVYHSPVRYHYCFNAWY